MSHNVTSKLVLDVQASIVTDVLDMHVVEKITKHKAEYDFKTYSTGSVLVPANTYERSLGVSSAVLATSSKVFGIRLSSMSSPVETSIFSYSGTSVEIILSNTSSEDVVVEYILASV